MGPKCICCFCEQIWARKQLGYSHSQAVVSAAPEQSSSSHYCLLCLRETRLCCRDEKEQKSELNFLLYPRFSMNWKINVWPMFLQRRRGVVDFENLLASRWLFLPSNTSGRAVHLSFQRVTAKRLEKRSFLLACRTKQRSKSCVRVTWMEHVTNSCELLASLEGQYIDLKIFLALT